jgi:hypothetical protein
MQAQPVTLGVRVAVGSDAGPEKVGEAASRLRRELTGVSEETARTKPRRSAPGSATLPSERPEPANGP